jgi:hypothetical protein
MTWPTCKHVHKGVFPLIGYVPDGKRIEAVLTAEKKGRGSGRWAGVEFWTRGVITPDDREAP